MALVNFFVVIANMSIFVVMYKFVTHNLMASAIGFTCGMAFWFWFTRRID